MNVKKLLSLKDKVVLVTGGRGLYGICISEGLAEAEGTVITASRSLKGGEEAAKSLRDKGFDVHAMQLDQGSHESIVNLKSQIAEKFGRLDVLVNCAVVRPMHRYSDPLEAFEESMRVNATGIFDITREFADLIEKSGGGSIVNIGSMQGMFGPDFNLYEGTDMDSPPDYHFHKGGMIALTKYLARKLGPRGIKVNCLSPGGLYAGQDPQFLERYNKKVPLGRMADHDDIKGAVVFLASDASSYITGENILMDGGLHA